MEGLKDKVAVVTGAGAKRSMGRAIAMELAASGAIVVAADKDAVPGSVFAEDAGWGGLAQVVQEMEAQGGKGLAVVADVSSEEDVDRLFREAEQAFGRVDIVVHCVGIRGPVPTPIEQMDMSVWQRMLNINLTGAFLVGRAAARAMIPHKSGSVLMISSMAGLKAYPGSVAYGATKHGVLGIVKTMAAELGKHGIRVNAICPGRFNTNFRDGFIQDEAGRTGADVQETAAKDQECPFPIWLGRAGVPADAANLAAFLVSDKASYITGETVVLDGGGA